MFSQSEAVIGKDLKFAGRDVKFVSQGKVKVDCEFEGDVTGTAVKRVRQKSFIDV